MGFPSFASGDVLNASDMNAVGLWLVKTQTFSAVSSTTVSDCFSSTYDNYLITCSNGTAVAQTAVYFRLRNSGGVSATNYQQAGIYRLFSTGAGADASFNTTRWDIGTWSTSPISSFSANIFGPQKTAATQINALSINFDASQFMAGGHTAATAYVSFDLIGATQNISGTVRVYGYRN